MLRLRGGGLPRAPDTSPGYGCHLLLNDSGMESSRVLFGSQEVVVPGSSLSYLFRVFCQIGLPLPLDGHHAKSLRPTLRILTKLEAQCHEPLIAGSATGVPESATTTLRNLLRQRYSELAPMKMPPHLESPDAIVPPLTPAMVHYPAAAKPTRGRTETRESRQARPAQLQSLLSQHHNIASEGWKPHSPRAWKS